MRAPVEPRSNVDVIRKLMSHSAAREANVSKFRLDYT